MPPKQQGYVCDTLPAPRLANAHDQLVSFHDDDPDDPEPAPIRKPETQPSPRKLCVRHQRMADEGTNLKLQQVCIYALFLAPC